MMVHDRALTAAAARAWDRRCQKRFGLSTLVLMENAGRAVAQEASGCVKGKRVAIVCGRGNNGADGFVAARHLLARGIRPDVYLAARRADLGSEAQINLRILRALKQPVTMVSQATLAALDLSRYGLIIDALFGVGLSRPLAGFYAGLVRRINDSGVRVLAVDIPSGLDATSGKALGCCVRADITVTFVALKRGMLTGQGKSACGRVVVVDLGVPRAL